MVTFAFDSFVNGVPYPNLASLDARPGTPAWHKFSSQFPYSEPVHFLEYLTEENVEFETVTVNSAPNTAIYPISVSFFDFAVDWFKLMPKTTLNRIKNKDLKVWFLYSEGDNPFLIKKHLVSQCEQYGVEWSQIHFTSANTSSDDIDGFSYFADDELLYRLRNTSSACEYHTKTRDYKFTALVRTHKWWRATTMTRLWKKFLHAQGYFSYNTIDINDQEDDNPIIVDQFNNLRDQTHLFLSRCPFTADNHSSDYHNDYSDTVDEHFTNSYLNIVLETQFDVGQSRGVFLSEKTFKPIKHCQPFIIVGASGSIKLLQQMGYKTFDKFINHDYDSIVDSTLRWDAVMTEVERLLLNVDLHNMYKNIKSDLLHNQKLFSHSKKQRLNTLLGKVLNEFS
jgi:hypothetical protein